jgi:hypothetical protein
VGESADDRDAGLGALRQGVRTAAICAANADKIL